MFYTSSNDYGSKTFIRGYWIDGKRFNYIRGFNSKDLSKDLLEFYDSINVKVFCDDTDEIILRKSDYEKHKDKIESFLSSNKNYLDIEVEPVKQKTVFDEECVKFEYNQGLHSFKRDWYQTNAEYSSYLLGYIPKVNDIPTSLKYNHKLIQSKKWNPIYENIKIAYIDIETESENGFIDSENPQERINVISIRLNGYTYVWSLEDFREPNDKVIKYYISNEKDMLEHFFNKFDELDIDVLTGWNIRAFDIPVIVRRYANLSPSCKRINKFSGKSEWNIKSPVMKLSPFRTFKEVREEGRFGSHYNTYEFLGIEILDYMLLYIKYILEPRSSYKLDSICDIELGEGKLDYSEQGSLYSLYKNDFQKFVEYNIQDVNLVDKLEQKLCLIRLVEELAYYSGITYSHVESPVRTWEAIIYNHLTKHDLLMPVRKEAFRESYPGAYVKPTKAGLYNWIVSFDVNSLYPSIMRQCNLSPETILDEEYHDFEKDSDGIEDEYHLKSLVSMEHNLDWLKDRNLCLSASGNLFRRDKQGFIPHLVEKLYAERVNAKKEMKKWKKIEQDGTDPNAKNQVAKYSNEQMARKVLLNSFYGALGNIYFISYDLRLAKSITLTGQVIIKYSEKRLNEYINEILETNNENYCRLIDTDSCYMDFSKIKEKFNFDLDKLDNFIQEKIEPFLEKIYSDLANYMNHFEHVVSMKREKIADRALFLNAKKRYALRTLDNEGLRYIEPKINITGLEVIKSSTPAGVKKPLKKILEIILDGDKSKLIDYIEEQRKVFMTLPLDEIAMVRSMKDIEGYRGDNYLEKIEIKKVKTNKSAVKVAVPIHNRASNVYNEALKKFNLTKKYPEIKSGDKIKMLLLKPGNKLNSDIVAYTSVLPTEFEIEEYIDKDLMFEKIFMANVRSITDHLLWNTSIKFTIDDLL